MSLQNLVQNHPQPVHILFKNCQPCDEVIVNPGATQLTETAREKAEAKRQAREEKYARTRNRIAHTLALYGPTGKPPGSYVPTPRPWTSLKPNHSLTELCAEGVFGETRTAWAPGAIADPWKAREARTARAADRFDDERFQEAQATVQGWKWSPSKNVGTAIIPMDAVTTRHAVYADCPVWLVETLTPRTTAHQKEKSSARERVTVERLNRIYEEYSEDPRGKEGSLIAALYAHTKIRFAKKARERIAGQGYQSADDIVLDFVLHVMTVFREPTEERQYTHSGQLDRWLAKTWRNFFNEELRPIYAEANRTIGLNPLDEWSEDGDETPLEPGRVNPAHVDRERINRDSIQFRHSATARVAYVFAGFDDPSSPFYLVSDSTKKMVLAMAAGETKEQAATTAGISPRQGRRALRALAALREHSFSKKKVKL